MPQVTTIFDVIYKRHPETHKGLLSYGMRVLVLGDSDGITLEHAVRFFRLLGGGVMGDLEGMPRSQLAVLPATSHFIPPGSGILDRSGWLLAMIPPFLNTPD